MTLSWRNACLNRSAANRRSCKDSKLEMSFSRIDSTILHEENITSIYIVRPTAVPVSV